MSTLWANAFSESIASVLTMASPMAMAETRKRYGRKKESYQRGDIFDGAMRKTAPREDWCRVESMTPKTTAPI